jgi:hypothetical protein
VERISDEAIVVRGGRNRSEDVRRGIGTHPSGVTGISVECEEGVSVQELSASIPHGQVGVTTVAAVRDAGRSDPNIWKKPISRNADGANS